MLSRKATNNSNVSVGGSERLSNYGDDDAWCGVPLWCGFVENE